jgi:hypothetical protein
LHPDDSHRGLIDWVKVEIRYLRQRTQLIALGDTLYDQPNSRTDALQPSASELPLAGAASIYQTCSGRLPTDPDAPNIVVLPNHVTMPVGVAIVEGQVEVLR